MSSRRPTPRVLRNRALAALLATVVCASGGYWAASAFASAGEAPSGASSAVEAAAEPGPEPGTETSTEAASEPTTTPTTTTEETPAPVPPVPSPESGSGGGGGGSGSDGGGSSGETPEPTQGSGGGTQETTPSPVAHTPSTPGGHETPRGPLSSTGSAQSATAGGGSSNGSPAASADGVGTPYLARHEVSPSLSQRGSNSAGDHTHAGRSSSHRAPHGSDTPAAAAPSAQSLADAFAEITPVLPGIEGLAEDAPPSFLLPIYHAAGKRYHVPWAILAAINQVETDFGRDLSTSSAGAVGWMQFMPATWAEWGVDADGDGTANPYSPIDAIYSAARYLHANGASADLPAAIFAYNHAGWYVSAVMLRARMLEHTLAGAPLRDGYSLPLDSRYMAPLGRTDDGVDIENAPDGALVYSMTPGVVTAVASDPAGFGPNYPVVQATAGPLAGQYIYYGHVVQSLVREGERVSAGEPIAIVGHTGDAASLGHGHIEIGFGDAAGTPMDQHGAIAATAAGAVMRSFLVELSASFGVANG